MNKQMANITECPKCGEKELGLGTQNGYAVIYPKGVMSFGSNIEHLICTECGLIIESYVVKPDKFKNTLTWNNST